MKPSFPSRLFESVPYIAGGLTALAIVGSVREVPGLALGCVVMLAVLTGILSRIGRRYPWGESKVPSPGIAWHEKARQTYGDHVGGQLIVAYTRLVSALIGAVLIGGLSVTLAGLFPRYVLVGSAAVLGVTAFGTFVVVRHVIGIVDAAKSHQE